MQFLHILLHRLRQDPGICPKDQYCLDHFPINIVDTRGSPTCLLSSFPSRVHTRHAFPAFRRTSIQSLSDRSKILPSYLKVSSPSMHSAPSSPVRLKDASTHRLAIAIVSPPSPYMSVPVVPLRPLVLDQPPCWHVHVTQVTAGKRPPPFLHHRYPQIKSVCT